MHFEARFTVGHSKILFGLLANAVSLSKRLGPSFRRARKLSSSMARMTMLKMLGCGMASGDFSVGSSQKPTRCMCAFFCQSTGVMFLVRTAKVLASVRNLFSGAGGAKRYPTFTPCLLRNLTQTSSGTPSPAETIVPTLLSKEFAPALDILNRSVLIIYL